jgi:hypothetical protein
MSPHLMESIYETRLQQAFKKSEGLIRQIRLDEVDILTVAEGLAEFAENLNLILQVSGGDAFLDICDCVPECFSHELTKILVRVKALSHILSLNAHSSHIEIVPIMLKRVWLDMMDLKARKFYRN